MIGVRARGIVVRIVGRFDPQSARHVQKVGDADLRPWIARVLPRGNGRRLRQPVGTLVDKDTHERCRHALAHRPALECRVRCDAFAVPLADDPSSPRDRKSTRLNSSHGYISYAVFCLKKKKKTDITRTL